ncbi:type III-B CRISPR module-associated protein Cmr3 [Anaerolinea sp.]|uniref:type III-B CRISPR module-associated protein Cmr3 n=1 Tax=Anaerolinea sp. TaxID=1872519 RepID=UPI002ACD9676|nr:type III-B CRISPR module-associated protein Cmr3 [Anaerolinea sp.]
MTWLFIEAEDVWFFRDTRSFGRGEDHVAGCLFPPFPATVAGAIRARVIGEHPHWEQNAFNNGSDTDLFNRIGKPDDLGPYFRLRGPFLARRMADGTIHQYYPLPKDTFFEDVEESQFGVLRPHNLDGLNTNWETGAETCAPLWPPKGERKDGVEEDYWLSPIAVEFYQQQEKFSATPKNEFYIYEERTGIARDWRTRRAEKHMLYLARFVRPKPNTGLLVWVANEVQLPESGWLSLGGESRAARFQRIEESQVRLSDKFITTGKQRLKVILLTPSYFQEGWRPQGGDWSKVGLPAGAKLRATALGRPLVVSGWDIARGPQKPLRTFVPAGSVYYFEWNEPLQTELEPSQITFTEEGPGGHYHRLGLGQILLADWDWEP